MTRLAPVDAKTLAGALVGMAVGDSLGLPYEGLAPGMARKLFGPPERHRLLFGRGMISDDTEHALFTVRAFIRAGGDPDRFAHELGKEVKRWLLTLPPGIGLATLRSGFKLLMGAGPEKSGVRSEGNGPAMRAPVLGLLAKDETHLESLVLASSRLTHSSSAAAEGALYLAWEARGLTVEPGPDSPFREPLARARASALKGDTPHQFAQEMGWTKGPSGWNLQTVPACLQACWRFPGSYREAVMGIIEAGGDADTTGAIVGAIVGARCGRKGIPVEWQKGLWEGPRTADWMEKVAIEAVGGRPLPPGPGLSLIPLRAVLLAAVLAHGIRRIAPPY